MSFRIFLVFTAASTLAMAQAPPAKAPAKSSATQSALTNADQKFLTEALQGNRGEVALGKLASQKGMDPQVKAFGDMMVKDHTQGAMEIESLMKNLNVTVPAEKQDPMQAKLEKLSGAAFDKAYISDMVSDHKKDVAEFKKESTAASNPDVRNLATKMLPTLQMHLDHVNMIHAQLNKKGTADRSTPSTTTAPGESIPTKALPQEVTPTNKK